MEKINWASIVNFFEFGLVQFGGGLASSDADTFVEDIFAGMNREWFADNTIAWESLSENRAFYGAAHDIMMEDRNNGILYYDVTDVNPFYDTNEVTYLLWISVYRKVVGDYLQRLYPDSCRPWEVEVSEGFISDIMAYLRHNDTVERYCKEFCIERGEE